MRTIAVPTAIRAEIVEHLMADVDSRPDALLFNGPNDGRALRRTHFNNLTKWVETVRKLGVPGLHFHDLRHTGNYFAAQTGASTEDLMAWPGTTTCAPPSPTSAPRVRGTQRIPTG